MIVPLNSWYHRVSVTNKLIAYTEMVLWTWHKPSQSFPTKIPIGSQHTTWLCLFARSIELTTLFIFLYFKFEFLSSVKINVTETVLSCSLFRNKETKDYVTSPGAWACDILPLFSFILLWFTSRSPKCEHAGAYVYDAKIFGKERAHAIIHNWVYRDLSEAFALVRFSFFFFCIFIKDVTKYLVCIIHTLSHVKEIILHVSENKK
jgi:hypothetical protein